MTIALIILFVFSLLARILFGVFVDKVSVFAKLLTPFTGITVGLGVLAMLFIIVEVIKRLRK